MPWSLDSGAEVSVGRVAKAAGVSFCKRAEICSRQWMWEEQELKCLMVVSHVPKGRGFDRWYKDGHCARLLRRLDIPSGHIVVSNFVCALSDLLLISVTASMAQVKQ